MQGENEQKNGSEPCRLAEMLEQSMLHRERIALRPITKKQKHSGVLVGAHLGGVIGQQPFTVEFPLPRCGAICEMNTKKA